MSRWLCLSRVCARGAIVRVPPPLLLVGVRRRGRPTRWSCSGLCSGGWGRRRARRGGFAREVFLLTVEYKVRKKKQVAPFSDAPASRFHMADNWTTNKMISAAGAVHRRRTGTAAVYALAGGPMTPGSRLCGRGMIWLCLLLQCVESQALCHASCPTLLIRMYFTLLS